jgi:type IV pilus assembly protein PilC
MVYPSVVITVAILVIVIIMVFVVPTFSKMFDTLGGELPAPTQLIITVSDFLGGTGGLTVLACIVGIVVFIVQFKKTKRGEKLIDRIILRLPVIGILFRKVAVAKFTRTLGTLISSGVPILDGLNITAKTAAEPLSEAKVFPPMVNQMIAVGESTGALDNMLEKIADFYDDEVDNAVATLTSMIEPCLMVFLGGTVGFIVVAMYLPIFKLITLVK